MSAQELFYYFAIIYIIFSLLFLIGIGTVLFIFYKKARRIARTVTQNSTLVGVIQLARILPFAKLAPVITVLPLIMRAVKSFTGRKRG